MSWIIREEQPGDEPAIRALVNRAFIDHPYSDGDEAQVIDKLRQDGDLLLSLVAVDDDTVIGQVTFSWAVLSNGETGWTVIGPVAVDPSRQGEGIGRALIEQGEQAMRALGAKGVTVLGDPAIYARFGFVAGTPMVLEGELGPYLQVKRFTSSIPATSISYAPAFTPGG